MASDDGPRMTWEQAVEWARQTPELRGLVELCYYDDPIEAAAHRFASSEEWIAIVSLLQPKPESRVLEIGAGRGLVSWAFAKAGCQVDALEPDPSELIGAGAIRRLCETTGQVVSVHSLAGENLPFADGTFDIVVCRGVLHHVADLDQVCREVFRVLQPGGRFLAIKEHVCDTPVELARFLREHPLHHLYGGEHAYALRAYLAAMRGAGLGRLRRFGHFDHPVTSAPACTTEGLRTQFAGALGRRLPSAVSSRLASNATMLHLYRRWLTYGSAPAGRLMSFLSEKSR